MTFGFSLFLLHPENEKKMWPLFAMTIVTLVAESAGYYLRAVEHQSNHPVYNISIPLIIVCFLWLFRGHLKQQHQKVLHIALITYLLFVVANLLFLQTMSRLATYNYILGTVVLTLACVYYFLEFIHYPGRISVLKAPLFWIASAVLILYIPKSVLYAVFEYLAYTEKITQSFGQTFTFINKVLCVVFFTFISYASVCRLIYRN
jgi:hypothetical protein